MPAIYEIGCFFGALFILLFGERFGRRYCILGGGAVMLVGAALQTASYGVPQLIVGRIVTGLVSMLRLCLSKSLTYSRQGNGANFSTLPVWASELCGHHQRGRVAAFAGWLIIWGVVIAYWVDYGCANYTNGMQFRFPIAFQVVFAIIMMIMVWCKSKLILRLEWKIR